MWATKYWSSILIFPYRVASLVLSALTVSGSHNIHLQLENSRLSTLHVVISTLLHDLVSWNLSCWCASFTRSSYGTVSSITTTVLFALDHNMMSNLEFVIGMWWGKIICPLTSVRICQSLLVACIPPVPTFLLIPLTTSAPLMKLMNCVQISPPELLFALHFFKTLLTAARDSSTVGWRLNVRRKADVMKYFYLTILLKQRFVP